MKDQAKRPKPAKQPRLQAALQGHANPNDLQIGSSFSLQQPIPAGAGVINTPQGVRLLMDPKSGRIVGTLGNQPQPPQFRYTVLVSPELM